MAELRALVALGAPLALTQLGQIAINTTDVIMLGWLGTEALAAGGLAMSIWILPALFSIGVAMAVAPLVAGALGARRPRQVRRSVRQGLWAVGAVTLPAVLALCFCGPLLIALGQAPSVADAAERYLRAAVWGLPFAAALVVLRGFMTSFGHTQAVLVVMALMVPANATLNYGLIFGNLGLPRLELVGAGVASTLVNVLGFLGLALVCARARPYRRYRVFARLWRPDWTSLRAVLRLGVPIGLTLLLEIGMFTAAALLVGTIDHISLAAHHIALQLCAVVFMIPLGLSQASTVRVALAASHGDRRGVRLVGNLAILLTLAVMGTAALCFLLAPNLLVRPFVDDPSARSALVATAAGLLQVAAFFQLADGLQVVGGGLLRGLKDTTVPMIYALVGYWIGGVGTAAFALFILDAGARGVWFGLFAGLSITAALALRRFYRRTARRWPTT